MLVANIFLRLLEITKRSEDKWKIIFQDDWSLAKYYCKQLGMDLVSIESEEENAAITAALGKLSLFVKYKDLSHFVWGC